jgi:hypothetical protein
MTTTKKHDGANMNSSLIKTIRRSVPRTFLVVLCLLGGGVLTSNTAVAGVGIAPVNLQFDEALRGGSFEQSLQLSNEPSTAASAAGDAKLLEFKVTAQGEIADWISFFGPEGTTPQTVFNVARGERVNVRVRATIPSGAANRTYKGSVFVEASSIDPESVGKPGASVGTAADIAVNIKVGGVERRASVVSDFVIDSAEVGLKQRFTAKIRNTGNVSVSSQLDVKVTREGAESISLTSKGKNFPVYPEQDGEVFIDWDTSEQLGGAYLAEFTVTDLSGVTPIALGTKSLSFRLEPRGTFTRSGEFVELTLKNLPEAGGLVVAEALFLNSGKIPANAVFDGEISLNGKLIKSIQSLPRTVRPGETSPISITVDSAQAGNYRISGNINFDGELSLEKILEFTVKPVGAAAAQGDGTNETNPLVYGGAAAGIGLIGIGAFLALRKRRSHSLTNLHS